MLYAKCGEGGGWDQIKVTSFVKSMRFSKTLVRISLAIRVKTSSMFSPSFAETSSNKHPSFSAKAAASSRDTSRLVASK